MSATDQAQYLFQAVVMMQALMGSNYTQKWRNATALANEILDQNNTIYLFIIQTRPRIIEQAPCH
jgi:hypothetical protein